MINKYFGNMSTIQLISLVAMSAAYCLAGIMHFLNPKFFLKITPKWVPFPEKVNYLVGTIEIFLGVALLFPLTRSYAAIGIIFLLIAVFPANIYHHQLIIKKGRNPLITLVRLPVQGILIYWAYVFI